MPGMRRPLRRWDVGAFSDYSRASRGHGQHASIARQPTAGRSWPSSSGRSGRRSNTPTCQRSRVEAVVHDQQPALRRRRRASSTPCGPLSKRPRIATTIHGTVRIGDGLLPQLAVDGFDADDHWSEAAGLGVAEAVRGRVSWSRSPRPPRPHRGARAASSQVISSHTPRPDPGRRAMTPHGRHDARPSRAAPIRRARTAAGPRRAGRPGRSTRGRTTAAGPSGAPGLTSCPPVSEPARWCAHAMTSTPSTGGPSWGSSSMTRSSAAMATSIWARRAASSSSTAAPARAP